MLDQSQILIFAFPLVKIRMRGQLYQELIRPVACTCFGFSAYKNRNVGAAILVAGMPTAVSGRLHILVFAFPLIKGIRPG